MKPLSWDKQLGLASPLKCAANQSGQTNNPSKDKNEVGLDVSHHIHLAPEGRGKYFFLDIPSHRMSEMAIFQQPTILPHSADSPKHQSTRCPLTNCSKSFGSM